MYSIFVCNCFPYHWLHSITICIHGLVSHGCESKAANNKARMLRNLTSTIHLLSLTFHYGTHCAVRTAVKRAHFIWHRIAPLARGKYSRAAYEVHRGLHHANSYRMTRSRSIEKKLSFYGRTLIPSPRRTCLKMFSGHGRVMPKTKCG